MTMITLLPKTLVGHSRDTLGLGTPETLGDTPAGIFWGWALRLRVGSGTPDTGYGRWARSRPGEAKSLVYNVTTPRRGWGININKK